MLALFAAAIVYHATVVHAVDGDTLRVHVAHFPAPFDPIDVRIFGVDTPEHVKPPAQTDCEVTLGLKAAVFARTLVKPGDAITVTWSRKHDKYGRLLGSVTLPDGRDWASVMIAAGLGRPYGQDGDLHKAAWCHDAPPAQDPPH
jgi:endonuclease YncB( thermonuclease family)